MTDVTLYKHLTEGFNRGREMRYLWFLPSYCQSAERNSRVKRRRKVARERGQEERISRGKKSRKIRINLEHKEKHQNN